MDFPRVKAGEARASEERYRASVQDAAMERLGTTPERTAYFEAALDILWEYGDLAPYRVAADALRSGNRNLYERARAADARVTALANAAWRPE